MSPSALDALGLIASYVFVFGFIGVATLLMRRHVLPPSATRKVIHIGVAHWWLIAMVTMNDPWVASVGPFTFIAINALALRLKLLPAMDEGSDRRNLGTIYFPITLLVLVNLCWRGVMPIWVGGIAALVLGWGDGLAALVGEAAAGAGVRIWGEKWGGRKSLAGSVVMFAASFAVTLVFTLIFNTRFGGLGSALGVSVVVGAAAAAVELLTPLGLDNLTVPLAVAGLYAGVFL
jgi:phytol kinase